MATSVALSWRLMALLVAMVNCCALPTRNDSERDPPSDLDGGWNEWSTWSSCSATCGSAFRRRTRECDNPMPKEGGRDCPGSCQVLEACQVSPCKNNTCPPAICDQQSCPPKVKPRQACTTLAKSLTDIAIEGRILASTGQCLDNNTEYHTTVRVVAEMYRSPNCSFLPNINAAENAGSYNMTLVMPMQQECLCPHFTSKQVLVITASCNPLTETVRSHSRSLFKRSNNSIQQNLRHRCSY